MRPDLAADVGLVLAGIGGAMQWLRAVKAVRDGWLIPGALIGCLIVWVLCTDLTGAAKDWQAFTLRGIKDYIQLTTNMLGGTFLVALGADAAAAAKPSMANHPLMPVTDSK